MKRGVEVADVDFVLRFGRLFDWIGVQKWEGDHDGVEGSFQTACFMFQDLFVRAFLRACSLWAGS